VEVALAYTTRFFRRRPEHLDGDIAALIPPAQNGKRGGVMLAQESDRWVVSLIGKFGEVAPPELDGFIAFSRTIPAPYIYEVIKDAEPASDATFMRFPASVRRRYEKLDRFPEGYLVFGDAIASFNPTYGQGMSVVALESMELAATMAEGNEKLAQRFFRRAASAQPRDRRSAQSRRQLHQLVHVEADRRSRALRHRSRAEETNPPGTPRRAEHTGPTPASVSPRADLVLGSARFQRSWSDQSPHRRSRSRCCLCQGRYQD
jgi:hypothetical protein